MSIEHWLHHVEPLIWALQHAPDDVTDTELAAIVRTHWPR